MTFFERGSHYIAQASLRLEILILPSSGIAVMHHQAWPKVIFLCFILVKVGNGCKNNLKSQCLNKMNIYVLLMSQSTMSHIVRPNIRCLVKFIFQISNEQYVV
jgi:hypothetical protein